MSLIINLFPLLLQMNLSEVLTSWYFRNKRELPWRQTSSPYKIWLSEIILQQTRVDQGINYYLNFIQQYPGVEDLSQASLDEILKIWQGLGYYSRARNLHETARKVAGEYCGSFPESYTELLKLKGIGPYTAAAIASIAFNQPVAVIDGNVIRFLSRYFGLDLPFHSAEGKKEFEMLASGILDKKNPGLHNQALMEFGAVQCLPQNPDCMGCPLKDTCHAFINDMVNELPVKKTPVSVKERHFNYLVISSGNKIFLRKRTKKDIWKMLYDFPLIETTAEKSETEIINSPGWKEMLRKTESFRIIHTSKLYKHILTHQRIYARFFRIKIDNPHVMLLKDSIPVDIILLQKYAVPRLIEKYLLDNPVLP